MDIPCPYDEVYNEVTLMYPAGGVPDERFDYKTWLFAGGAHYADWIVAGGAVLIGQQDGSLFYTDMRIKM